MRIRWLALLGIILSAASSSYSQSSPRVDWACSLDAIGTTLTQCGLAAEPSMRLYVTDIVVGSTTATAGLFLIRAGTGTNCGTDTASVFPSAATVVRFGYPANTAAPATLRFDTPLMGPKGAAICVVCVVTNTCTVQMGGFVSP